MKNRKNNFGFTSVEIAIALVLVLITSITGFAVYKNKSKQNTKNSNSITQTKKISSSQKAFINVADGDKLYQLTPQQIAKSPEQEKILTDIHNSCSNTNSFVTVRNYVFDSSKRSFNQDGNYASISATKCDEKLMPDSLPTIYLHKNINGIWIIDGSTNMGIVDCNLVDGKSYPTSIIKVCYEGKTERAPK